MTRNQMLPPVARSATNTSTPAAIDTMPTVRLSRWYREALSSFIRLTAISYRLTAIGIGVPRRTLTVRADAHAAVGRFQFDRRAATVHFAFDTAPRLFGHLDRDPGDTDAAVRTRREHVGFGVGRQREVDAAVGRRERDRTFAERGEIDIDAAVGRARVNRSGEVGTAHAAVGRVRANLAGEVLHRHETVRIGEIDDCGLRHLDRVAHLDGRAHHDAAQLRRLDRYAVGLDVLVDFDARQQFLRRIVADRFRDLLGADLDGRAVDTFHVNPAVRVADVQLAAGGQGVAFGPDLGGASIERPKATGRRQRDHRQQT